MQIQWAQPNFSFSENPISPLLPLLSPQAAYTDAASPPLSSQSPLLLAFSDARSSQQRHVLSPLAPATSAVPCRDIEDTSSLVLVRNRRRFLSQPPPHSLLLKQPVAKGDSMGGGVKRKSAGSDHDDDVDGLSKGKKIKKDKTLPSMIKNKEKRNEVYSKLKREKRIEKRKQAKAREVAIQRALELGEEPPRKSVPRTIENTREVDETVCRPDDEELFAAHDADEFSGVLKQERIPKILITTNRFNSTRGPAFCDELVSVIPNAFYYKRGTYELKKIVEYAKNKDFTSVLVIHTNRREPDAMLIIGLPDGPTAHFKLSNLILRKDIKNHGNPTSHRPELVLNNFTTKIGLRVGRMIQSLFPQDPNFRGRRVVTFHNQRDFIFFRHHRYIFETKEQKVDPKEKAAKDSKSKNLPQQRVTARLQECGPRFTLKLRTLQHGTFDTQGGEYEWAHKPDMDTSRRRFFM